MQTEFYKNYIRSSEWKSKEQERKQIDNFKCVCCGRDESHTRYGLQVHHITYQRLGNENIWNDLVTVCGSCHKKIHNYYNRRRKEPD